MSDIIIIGGINIDIEGRPFRNLILQDSNPGKIKISYGGVGRNIAENAARIGVDCAMISLVGDDPLGEGALRQLKEIGVNTDMVKVVSGKTTSMYLSILDEKGDMEMAISDMKIIDELTYREVYQYRDNLKRAKVIALDGNLEEELLCNIVNLVGDIPIFYDPVSTNKAVRAKNIFGRFHSIKPNLMEAQILLGRTIGSEDELFNAGKEFIEKGVKKVFITLNKDGVFYMDDVNCGIIRPEKELLIKSATGAGDSFSAAILKGMVDQMNAREISKLGMMCSQITMESSEAVSKDLTYEEVIRRMKGYV